MISRLLKAPSILDEIYMILSTTSTDCTAPAVRRDQGFSLIELMVVVAILSILGMIAVPQYQRHVAKAKMAAALDEISVGTRVLDLMRIEDEAAIDYGPLEPEYIGLSSKSKLCVEILVNRDEFWCTLKPDPVMGPSPTIGFLRNSHENTWECSGSAGGGGQDLLPDQCRYRPRGP